MARVIDLLETEYAHELKTRRHSLLGHPTISVGTVRGGTQPNIVPDYCEIQVDRRTIPGEKDSKVQREIISFLHGRGATVELMNSKHPCIALETNPDLPMVSQFMKITRQRAPIGGEPRWPTRSSAD